MMDYYSTKRPGNLASAFNSDLQIELSDQYIKLKKYLASQFRANNTLESSWSRLLAEIDKESQIIKKFGPEIVPQIDFKDLISNDGKFPHDLEMEVRKRGCVVIRSVISKEEALKYKEEVLQYISNHPGEIVGFPQERPQVWELYWSKPQVAARSHPNFLLATKAVNQLWRAEPKAKIDFSNNVAYCDRLRIREPGDTSFKLNEHIDGGSVERWEDPEYRKCYANILNGDWERHDAFDATHRLSANMDMYNCSGGCSMFRTFQGWLSLSSVKPGDGTLRVCPLIKLSTAYLIMRPLLQDYVNEKDMGGATPGAQQLILPKIHQPIIENVVSIPAVEEGDVVFWHPDCVHAVESVCNSPADSSVLYIPATPLCEKNIDYMVKQKYAFVHGLTPHDFPLNNCELKFKDRAFPKDLTELGELVMGFKKFEVDDDGKGEGAQEAVKYANTVLGL